MSMEVREKMNMERLVQLAEEKQYRQLKEALLEFPAVDVAAFMEELAKFLNNKQEKGHA